MNGTLYWWKVRCIDRGTLQLFDRYLVFDPGPDAAPDQLCRAHGILDSKQRRHELVEIRSLFREVDEDELHRLMAQSNGSASVSPHEYFEDEKGSLLGLVDLVAIRTGQRDPIIVGNVESVLRLPHASLVNPAGWSVEKSNDVTHLLQLIGILQHTAWYRASLSLESQGEKLSLICPTLQEALPIFALLRQLLFQRRHKLDRLDDVFRRAVDH